MLLILGGVRSDHRRRKKLHGSGCNTTKAVLVELMLATNWSHPSLQDTNALLCHGCELRLINIKKAETKMTKDMKGIDSTQPQVEGVGISRSHRHIE